MKRQPMFSRRAYVKVQAPTWARSLMERIVRERYLGWKGGFPQLHWYRKDDGAHGLAWVPEGPIWARKIEMWAPLENGAAGRYVLLHELAHVFTTHKHTKDFWEMCFILCRLYGDLPEGYAEQRAINYKEKAASVLGDEWGRAVARKKACRLRTFIAQRVPQVKLGIRAGSEWRASYGARHAYRYGRQLVALQKKYGKEI